MAAEYAFIDALIFTAAGLLLGSFCNVVIARGPAIWGLVERPATDAPMSLAAPRSHCPACKTPLGVSELVPVFSFLWLKGKCRYCAAPISPRYPVVETLGGLAGLSAALLFPPFSAAVVLAALLLLICLGGIDQSTGYLPDALVGPLTALALGAGALSLFVLPVTALWGWVAGWGGLAVVGGLYRLWRGREGLGGGDAKLLGAGGALVGPAALPFVLLIAAGSALLGVWLTRRRSVSGEDEVRFGPWLAGGIALTLLAKAAWPNLLP